MTNKLICWAFLNYGLMNIVVFSSFFEPIRNFFKALSEKRNIIVKNVFTFIHEMITCPMCFATWGGFLTGHVIFSPVNVLYGISPDISWFFDGILSSGLVWSINSIVEYFEENRPN